MIFAIFLFCFLAVNLKYLQYFCLSVADPAAARSFASLKGTVHEFHESDGRRRSARLQFWRRRQECPCRKPSSAAVDGGSGEIYSSSSARRMEDIFTQEVLLDLCLPRIVCFLSFGDLDESEQTI